MAHAVGSMGGIGLAVLAATVTWLALALLPAACVAQGCAMCATYLNGQDPRTNAFRIAILFLMCMPFVVVGTAGGWILWMHWRHRADAAALGELQAEGEEAS